MARPLHSERERFLEQPQRGPCRAQGQGKPADVGAASRWGELVGARHGAPEAALAPS